MAREVYAQEKPNQHRIAIVIPSGDVSSISDKGTTIDRYSGEARPEGHAELARQVVDGKPDVIVAANNAVATAARATTDTIPLVWIGGDPVEAGFATSLAHPGG